MPRRKVPAPITRQPKGFRNRLRFRVFQPEAELHDLKERIESRKGMRQLSNMKEMKMGDDHYELVSV